MTELFVGPIMEKLINTLFDYLQDQFGWQTGMKEELERLRENHPKIQAVVSAASQAQIIDQNPALNKWIWQLRDAIDEAEDLLDEFEYLKHEERLATNTEEETKVSPPQSLLFAAARKLCRVGEHALKIDPNLMRLEEVVQKLDRVSGEVSTFLHLIEITKLEQQLQLVELHKTRETGSLPANDLLGRDELKKSVIEWLRKPSNEEHQTQVSIKTFYNNISLLSIVGHGGMGKTTLLQHVYEEDEITKEFDLKMWVSVSYNFDVKKVIGDMLESFQNNRPSLESLHALQESLKLKVKSKKFLLVLDDIWEEDEERDKSKWEKVFATLAGGGVGSKILITTRMDSVASMIAKVIKKKKDVLILEGLREDECLQLLTTHAFADVNPDDHKKLRSIAGELVKKLSGSPLGAKVMGGFLSSSLDERHWRKVLNSDLGQNDIFPILKLSYIFLPKHLQNCFAFCSIFPQDYQFEKFDLVRMWIAVGFIQPSNVQEETLEDIGERYFDVLVKKSFFDDVHTYYKMHDLLHELAQFVSKQECFRDEGDEELLLRTPETIRHLSIKYSNLKVLRKMGGFKYLRTLCVIVYDENYLDYADTFNEIFKVTKNIRLLDIQIKGWNELSNMMLEGIGYLMHLRFLRYNFRLTPLPRSLSKLFQLQFIICPSDSTDYYPIDNFFPRDMNNLSNLRFLNYPRLNFSGFGKLMFLQQLKEFYVKNEIGYRIEELKHMNDLCMLGIYQLENLRDATEACNAKLCYKRKLTNLSLDWGPQNIIYREKSVRQNIINPDLYERVFDNLQPYKHLKELKMNTYMGVRSAAWMNEAHLIKNLEKIEIFNCLEWQILPQFGQLPFLKILKLENMPKAKRLDNKYLGNDKNCDFPSLEKLYIYKLEALEDWFDARVDCLFPCLTELELHHCPNLQELPYLPPKLETLVIDNIGWKTLNCCNISRSIPLKTLRVRNCRNITFISMDCEIGTLAMLETVEIVDCPNLISQGEHQEVETSKNYQLKIHDLTIRDPSLLQMEPLISVSYVRFLRIRNNNEVISFSFEAERWFQQVSSSVVHIRFWYLESLRSLPSILTSFSSLENLFVVRLSQLQELPDLPSSVERLELSDLKSLQCLPSSLSTISSLKILKLEGIPLLKSLPQLPPSLEQLKLERLNNLECLPSCLSSLSSLKDITINEVPLLRELPNLPPPLCTLRLYNLENLECLPSCLASLSSLTTLCIKKVSLLSELPNLPLSLEQLNLERIDNLECLPSCLPNLSSLGIFRVPLLQELPNLPPSLRDLDIRECDPDLMKRYEQFLFTY